MKIEMMTEFEMERLKSMSAEERQKIAEKCLPVRYMFTKESNVNTRVTQKLKDIPADQPPAFDAQDQTEF